MMQASFVNRRSRLVPVVESGSNFTTTSSSSSSSNVDAYTMRCNGRRKERQRVPCCRQSRLAETFLTATTYETLRPRRVVRSAASAGCRHRTRSNSSSLLAEVTSNTGRPSPSHTSEQLSCYSEDEIWVVVRIDFCTVVPPRQRRRRRRLSPQCEEEEDTAAR